MKETTTKTIRSERIIELEESDLVAILRQHFNLPFDADVEFHTMDHDLTGATIRITKVEVIE